MSEILSNIREGFSPKEIKMAIGIASDPRYKGGNMTGAVNAIEKIKKGLSNHKQVAAVLKRQNEENDEPASPDEGGMATDQLEFIKYAADEIMQHIQGGGEFPEWMQNKLSGTHEKMKSLHANIDHANVQDQKEEVELEEGKSSTGYELYHKDFSSAMAHAYDFAKKKFGIEVDPKEIDDKVASGPRKPSKGKTNSYRLLGKDGKKAIQVQVYGMDNGKYELNMYKEETMKEAALMIAEKLKVSDGLGAWITDFQKSDAPQFAGKSDEQKKKMAIAAFVDAGGKLDEETIDENMKRVAKELEDYARKNGGIDKMDFMKAAMMMKKGQSKQLMKFVDELDTEPREKILSLIDKDSERRKEYKAYQKSKRNEEIDPIIAEGMVDDLAKEFEKRVKKQGHSSRTQDRERMAVLGMAKKKGASPADMKKLDAAIVSIINKLNEEEEPQKPDTAKAVDQMRDDKKKTRIAQLQLQIAKAQETINKLNAQEKPSE